MILEARPALMVTLQTLILGDWETGNGTRLTDTGVQSLLRAATSLVYLRLGSCTNLTDATLITAFESYPKLIYINISGHDRSAVRVIGSALKHLKDNPALAPKLEELKSYDQAMLDKEIKAVTRVRRLKIVEGETNKWRAGMDITYMRGDMIF